MITEKTEVQTIISKIKVCLRGKDNETKAYCLKLTQGRTKFVWLHSCQGDAFLGTGPMNEEETIFRGAIVGIEELSAEKTQSLINIREEITAKFNELYPKKN